MPVIRAIFLACSASAFVSVPVSNLCFLSLSCPSVLKESQSDPRLDQSDRSISFPVRSRALSATRSLRFFWDGRAGDTIEDGSQGGAPLGQKEAGGGGGMGAQGVPPELEALLQGGQVESGDGAQAITGNMEGGMQVGGKVLAGSVPPTEVG